MGILTTVHLQSLLSEWAFSSRIRRRRRRNSEVLAVSDPRPLRVRRYARVLRRQSTEIVSPSGPWRCTIVALDEYISVYTNRVPSKWDE